jgi:hypothetical protein
MNSIRRLEFSTNTDSFLQFDSIRCEIKKNTIGMDRTPILYFDFFLKSAPYIQNTSTKLSFIIPIKSKTELTITTEDTRKTIIIELDNLNEEWQVGSTITFYKAIELIDIERLSRLINKENLLISLKIIGYVYGYINNNFSIYDMRITKISGNKIISNSVFYSNIIEKCMLHKKYIPEFVLDTEMDLITSTKSPSSIKDFIPILSDLEYTLKLAIEMLRKATKSEDYNQVMGLIRRRWIP